MIRNYSRKISFYGVRLGDLSRLATKTLDISSRDPGLATTIKYYIKVPHGCALPKNKPSVGALTCDR